MQLIKANAMNNRVVNINDLNTLIYFCINWEIHTRFLYLIPVVLLDTTTVLGELGWKTYPLNGVSLNIFLKMSSLLGF